MRAAAPGRRARRGSLLWASRWRASAGWPGGRTSGRRRLLPLVWGDRTRLQQVALNLISNAVKFTSKGSVSLWVEVGLQEVMVAVSDTGMGIPLAEQEIIFDEFRQSDRAARRGLRRHGPGAGDQPAAGRAARRPDRRACRRAPNGAGSTFYFTLPILARPAMSPAELPISREHAVLLLTERAAPARRRPRLRDHLLGRGFTVATLASAGQSGLARPNRRVAARRGRAGL